MNTNRSKNSNLIDEVNKIIVYRKVYRIILHDPSPVLDDGSPDISGKYILQDDIANGKLIARCTPEDGDHYDTNLTIVDSKGNNLLVGKYKKRKCSQHILNVHSPAGFLLGSVRARRLKCSGDYEIRSANHKVLFLLKAIPGTDASHFTIKCKDGELVAKLQSSPAKNGKVKYTITYLKNIPVVEKALILCKVVSFCPTDRNCHKSIQHICSILKTKVLFCTLNLLHENPCEFFIVCMLSPCLIVMYFVFIFAFVAYFLGTLCTLFFTQCSSNDTDFACVFTWLCRLCANKKECKHYDPCQNNLCCKVHLCLCLTPIILFIIFFFCGGFLIVLKIR